MLIALAEKRQKVKKKYHFLSQNRKYRYKYHLRAQAFPHHSLAILLYQHTLTVY